MSTNATTDDGLGGTPAAAPGEEEEHIVDEPLRPSTGLVPDDDEGGEPAQTNGKGAETAATADWLASLDEETREYARSKNWKGPADVARSAREAEQAMRATQGERDRIARERDELAAYFQGAPGAEQQDEDPFDLTRLGESMELGETTTADALKHLMHEVVPRIAYAVAQQQVQPVATHQQTDVMKQAANEMAETYPDFMELSPEVIEVISKNPQHYNSPDGMRAAYGLVRSKRDAQQAAERKRSRRAETMDRGSLGQGTQSAAQAIVEAMDRVGGRPSDGL